MFNLQTYLTRISFVLIALYFTNKLIFSTHVGTIDSRLHSH